MPRKTTSNGRKTVASTTGTRLRSASVQKEVLTRLAQEFDPTSTLEDLLGLGEYRADDEGVGTIPSPMQPIPTLSELAPNYLVVQERLWAIYDAILSGYTSAYIEYTYAQKFDTSIRVVRHYIHIAHRLIFQLATANQKELLSHHMAFRRQLRAKALEDGDLELAFNAAKDEARLYGLYPEQSLSVNFKGSATLRLPTDVINLLDAVYGRQSEKASSHDGETPTDDEEDLSDLMESYP